jgi:dolichyl-phosphate-mannose--protein O-mannosyl transferase
MNADQNRPPGGLVLFTLQAAKLIGIAILSLVGIGAVVIVSLKTGIVVSVRWVGLFFCSCFLLWFVFRLYKRDKA